MRRIGISIQTTVVDTCRLRRRQRRLLRRCGIAGLLGLAIGNVAIEAQGQGRICSSHDVLLFGNRAVGSSTSARATVSNCGNKAWSFTGVDLHPATDPEFHVDTTCATGLVLVPGATCTIDVRFAPLGVGDASGVLWLHNSTSTPHQFVSFYGRGVGPGLGTATLAFEPSSVVFPDQRVGTSSAPRAVRLRNLGPSPLTPSIAFLSGPAAYDFSGHLDTCRIGTPIPVGQACQVSLGFLPRNPGAHLANLVIAAPELAAPASLQVVGEGVIAALENVSGLWWAAPPGSESGWGINFAHQHDTIFATWFTYDVDGSPWWLIAVLRQGPNGSYSGPVSTVTGPAFDTVPFEPAAVMETQVGTMTATFTDRMHATLSYTVKGITRTKEIVPQEFGPLPTCTWGAQSNLASATNYTDLWWNAPAGSESGWGVNLAHQGDLIFATWFTYDAAGRPWWLIAELQKSATGEYSGAVSTATGPPFGTVPFDPGKVRETVVGTASVAFVNGNSASLAYSVNGIARTKAITRQVFEAPGTVCQ